MEMDIQLVMAQQCLEKLGQKCKAKGAKLPGTGGKHELLLKTFMTRQGLLGSMQNASHSVVIGKLMMKHCNLSLALAIWP